MIKAETITKDTKKSKPAAKQPQQPTNSGPTIVSAVILVAAIAAITFAAMQTSNPEPKTNAKAAVPSGSTLSVKPLSDRSSTGVAQQPLVQAATNSIDGSAAAAQAAPFSTVSTPDASNTNAASSQINTSNLSGSSATSNPGASLSPTSR